MDNHKKLEKRVKSTITRLKKTGVVIHTRTQDNPGIVALWEKVSQPA